MSRTRRIALLVMMPVWLLASCGTTSSGRVDAADGETNQSHSSEWLDQGRQADENYQASSATSTPYGQPLEALGTKFPSTLMDPVDVTAPGLYVFRGGPVPSDSNVANASVSFPADVSTSFALENPMTVPVHLESENGLTYVTFTINISEVKEPYDGLRPWVL